MAHDEIKELDARGLRNFALTTGGIVVLVFGLLVPWLLGHFIPRWPWVIGGVLVVMGMTVPAALQPVYRNWMKFGLLMSKVTTPLVMGVAFYTVLTPMGLIRRLLGMDSLARKFDSSTSYRVASRKAPTKNLEKPF